MHNTPHALESSGKDLQAVMTLWDICRVRLGGHVTKTEGYDINTPPLLHCGSFFPRIGAGQKSSLRLPRAQGSLKRAPPAPGQLRAPGTKPRHGVPLRAARPSAPLQVWVTAQRTNQCSPPPSAMVNPASQTASCTPGPAPSLLWTHDGPIERRAQRPPPSALASSRGPPPALRRVTAQPPCWLLCCPREAGRRAAMRGGGCRSSPLLPHGHSLARRQGRRLRSAPAFHLPPVLFASRPGLRAGQPPVRGRQCRAPWGTAPARAAPPAGRCEERGEGEAGGWGCPPPSPRGSSVLFFPALFPLLLPAPSAQSLQYDAALAAAAGRRAAAVAAAEAAAPAGAAGRLRRGGGERRLRSRSRSRSRSRGGCGRCACPSVCGARARARARGGGLGVARGGGGASAQPPRLFPPRSPLHLEPGRGCYMKVKAAAGALGAPGWGGEGCCEPRLCVL